MLELPGLPYPYHGLEPVISRETLVEHHQCYHKNSVEQASALVVNTRFEAMSLVEIIREAHKDPSYEDLFNQAAQAWNHSFYWRSLSPTGGGKPPRALQDVLEAQFGTYAHVRDCLIGAAQSCFGSGYVWMTASGTRIDVTGTPNAVPPLVRDEIPILGIDVWEHAYYLDYGSDRDRYVTQIIDNLLNWDFVLENFKQA